MGRYSDVAEKHAGAYERDLSSYNYNRGVINRSVPDPILASYFDVAITEAVAPYRAVLEKALGERDDKQHVLASGMCWEWDGVCRGCGHLVDDRSLCKQQPCWRYQARALMEEGR